MSPETSKGDIEPNQNGALFNNDLEKAQEALEAQGLKIENSRFTDINELRAWGASKDIITTSDAKGWGALGVSNPENGDETVAKLGFDFQGNLSVLQIESMDETAINKTIEALQKSGTPDSRILILKLETAKAGLPLLEQEKKQDDKDEEARASLYEKSRQKQFFQKGDGLSEEAKKSLIETEDRLSKLYKQISEITQEIYGLGNHKDNDDLHFTAITAQPLKKYVYTTGFTPEKITQVEQELISLQNEPPETKKQKVESKLTELGLPQNYLENLAHMFYATRETLVGRNHQRQIQPFTEKIYPQEFEEKKPLRLLIAAGTHGPEALGWLANFYHLEKTKKGFKFNGEILTTDVRQQAIDQAAKIFSGDLAISKAEVDSYKSALSSSMWGGTKLDPAEVKARIEEIFEPHPEEPDAFRLSPDFHTFCSKHTSVGHLDIMSKEGVKRYAHKTEQFGAPEKGEYDCLTINSVVAYMKPEKVKEMFANMLPRLAKDGYIMLDQHAKYSQAQLLKAAEETGIKLRQHPDFELAFQKVD